MKDIGGNHPGVLRTLWCDDLDPLHQVVNRTGQRLDFMNALRKGLHAAVGKHRFKRSADGARPGSLLQRRLGLPDASVLLLQGIAFVLILASEALRDTDWKAWFAKLARVPSAGPEPQGEKA